MDQPGSNVLPTDTQVRARSAEGASESSPLTRPRGRGLRRLVSPGRSATRRRRRQRRDRSGLPSSKMEDNVPVKLSGFVLGSLVFQHLNADGDSEGFLVGEMQGEATSSSITDYRSDTLEVVNVIDIQRYIPCFRAFSFYSSSGEVNEEILKKLCSDKNVIGWYKFRCNSDQIITLREKILHKNLQRLLLNPGFVFLLLTPNIITENCSTYTMDYALHVLKDGFFQRMPLIVSNLAVSEQQGYKTVPGACTSIGFSQATCIHRSDFFDQDGNLRDVPKISQLCASMQEELKKASIELFESEKLTGKLLKDVKRLKEEVAKRKREKQASALRSRHPEGEENVLLCQALRTFFPDQEYLHSSTLTLQGKQVSVTPCTTEHKLDVVDELTLMVESSDEAPEDGNGARGEVKHEPLELGEEKIQVLEYELKGEGEGDDQGKVLATSVEPDEEIEDIEYQKSPTF